ncbi:hypothetical protein MBLNU230_g7786t2 [Neophaeotheca triangularis]
MIILIRHAQSEGNKNRQVHQLVPDHRVKLTDEGHHQAEEAGRRLRSLLKPDDTLQFYTSPYRRTRETTEGILRTLTSSDPDDPSSAPSPFSRHSIKVYEEPRLREQDFGNFQPCSAEMERMWQERADYGHFFYRIPNGESAADAYDRISGFNESLWRSFGEAEFPSVCVLVTHGLMTRVFLMKWYHWSVEYFEDLRNVNHCEFVLMKQNQENKKYTLQNDLRTWSELKRERQLDQRAQPPKRKNTVSQFLTNAGSESPSIPAKKWGGCVEGCRHDHSSYPARDRKKAAEAELSLPPAASPGNSARNESDDHALSGHEPTTEGLPSIPPNSSNGPSFHNPSPTASRTADNPSGRPSTSLNLPFRPRAPISGSRGRDFGGSESGAATPAEGLSDSENTYFEAATQPTALATALRKTPKRKTTVEDIDRWELESGMGKGKRADALGDEPEEGQLDGADADEGRFGGGEAGLEEREKWDRGLRGSVY